MKDAIATGHTVYLRLATEQDVLQNDWHMWYNDYETTKFNSHGVFPISRASELDYVKAALANPKCILFSVVAREEEQLIGNVSLSNIDLLQRKAEIALTIGDPDFRSRTSGIEAIGLAIEHGFSRLNLNRIYGGAHEGLSRWVKMLAFLGFSPEGTFREDFFRDGEFHDTLRFAVLARNYFELKKSRGGRILCEDFSSLMKGLVKID